MSLFGSLYSSASGLMAQSRQTGYISQNIANLTTTGYKRSEAAFTEIVGDIGRYTLNNKASGGVLTTRLLKANQQGSILQTASGTDAAIIGHGFFAVRATDDPTANFLYTRNGTFNEDANGFLRNSAGFILYGSAIDPATGQAGDITDPFSLVPVDVSAFDETSIPTSLLTVALNLNAGETAINPQTLSPPTALPVNALTDPSYSRSFTIYDTTGAPRLVNMEFRKITGPMAQFTSSVGAQLAYGDALVNDPESKTPAMNPGDTLDITNGTDTLTVTFAAAPANATLNEANTVQDLLDRINNFTDVDGNPLFEARLTSQGQLLVQAINPVDTIDISASNASVLGSGGLNIVPDDGVPGDYLYEPFAPLDADSAAYPEQTLFPAIDNIETPNTQTWWEVTILSRDPANPNGNDLVPLSSGLINFNPDGSLNALPGAGGGFDITLPGPVDFDSATTGEETTFSINLAQITQFNGNSSVTFTEQNGAPTGLRTDVEITRDGYVLAKYSNGVTSRLYQIPLVTFINPNGLNDQSGTVFAESADSGLPVFKAVGEDGAGLIQSASLENSNVDLGNEFGNLILTQRAYSLNTQVIRAVDEMTQNLSLLVR